MAVFQTGVADIPSPQAGQLCQLFCYILGVLAGFFDIQQHMLASATGAEIKLLFNNKILSLLAQQSRCSGLPI